MVNGIDVEQLEELVAENRRLKQQREALAAIAVRIVGAAISQPEDREQKLQEAATDARATLALVRSRQ